MRAALKILQQPRHLGIGLCFEEAEVIPELAQADRFGCANALDITERSSWSSSSRSDQMSADRFQWTLLQSACVRHRARNGLPRMVYAGATRDEEELSRLIAAVQRRDQGQGLAFCNRFGLSLTLATHRAFGKMTSKEAALWRRWRTDRGDDIVDAVRDTDDPFPALIDAAQQVAQSIRHPRAYLRHMASKSQSMIWTTAMATGVL